MNSQLPPIAGIRIKDDRIGLLSDRLLRLRIAVLQASIDDCLRFYPWPALAASWRADIDRLEAELKARGMAGLRF